MNSVHKKEKLFKEESEEKKNPDQGECVPPPLYKRLSAEVLGTFALTIASAGGAIVSVLPGTDISFYARTVAPSLVIMANIFALGKISGAHFNPIVTIAFALKKDFPFGLVPLYLAAEFMGALLAILVLQWAF